MSKEHLKMIIKQWSKDNMWNDAMGVNWYEPLDSKQKKSLKNKILSSGYVHIEDVLRCLPKDKDIPNCLATLNIKDIVKGEIE